VSAAEVPVHEAKPGLLRRYLPILHWLPTYQRGWLAPDAVAAPSVTWRRAGAIDDVSRAAAIALSQAVEGR
jgi:hypothetical protein